MCWNGPRCEISGSNPVLHQYKHQIIRGKKNPRSATYAYKHLHLVNKPLKRITKHIYACKHSDSMNEKDNSKEKQDILRKTVFYLLSHCCANNPGSVADIFIQFHCCVGLYKRCLWRCVFVWWMSNTPSIFQPSAWRSTAKRHGVYEQ